MEEIGEDEGCGGREDGHKQEQETNQPDMFVSMAPINIQMAAMDNIVSFFKPCLAAKMRSN